MSRGSSSWAPVLVVGVLVVGGVAWWALRPSEPAGNGPTPVDTGEGPSPARPPDPSHQLATPSALPPKEAVAVPEERLPVPPDWPGGLRIQVPDVPETLEVTGERLRDAIV